MELIFTPTATDQFYELVLEKLKEKEIDLNFSTLDFIEDCFESKLTLNETIEVLLIYDFCELKK